ncbi:Cyclin-like protein [Pseudocohnilembus persalinus]|uniref:Cyclin-like protein n=1 Tax=Pseudocohnilembus persalinus TaxID=266149 RepID=A0A0V0QBC2_PSEPJ|nr:Cyclin-like protein [Pseudocohnilembus persalinus]|eukprot:KRW99451.1 Cyclin-like protein [Pseudocohnilembus persalinus]
MKILKSQDLKNNINRIYHSHRLLNYQDEKNENINPNSQNQNQQQNQNQTKNQQGNQQLQQLQQQKMNNQLMKGNLMNMADFQFKNTNFAKSPYQQQTKQSKQQPPQTPMSNAMEMYSWLQSQNQLWKIMDFYLKFDLNMPLQLKTHILDLEQKITSYYVWQEQVNGKQNSLKQFISLYLKGNIQEAVKITQAELNLHEMFFRRLLHQCAYTIWSICEQQGIKDQIQENIWATVKHIIANETELLINRHLEQIILCTIYSISKIHKQDVKFQDLIRTFENLYQQQIETSTLNLVQSDLNEIIYNLNISENQKGDIITYYNQVFIQKIKSYIISKKQEFQQENNQQSRPSTPGCITGKYQSLQQYSKNPVLNTQILQSPLKMMIPSNLQNVRKSLNKLPGHMTPQTQMLYAYNESPLLKMGKQNNRFSNLQSKKMINFDELSINNQKNNLNVQKQSMLENYYDQTTDFINKKFNKINGGGVSSKGSMTPQLEKGMLKFFQKKQDKSRLDTENDINNDNYTTNNMENNLQQKNIGNNFNSLSARMMKNNINVQNNQNPEGIYNNNKVKSGYQKQLTQINFDGFKK